MGARVDGSLLEVVPGATGKTGTKYSFFQFVTFPALISGTAFVYVTALRAAVVSYRVAYGVWPASSQLGRLFCGWHVFLHFFQSEILLALSSSTDVATFVVLCTTVALYVVACDM